MKIKIGFSPCNWWKALTSSLLLDRETYWKAGTACEWALYQLASGVQWLHSSGKLHRDLKPSNVLVRADGKVVILDFGLVTESESDFAVGSQLAGSPSYMAPEQAARGAIREAADWYAVGVIAYKAITGGSRLRVLGRKYWSANKKRQPLPV